MAEPKAAPRSEPSPRILAVTVTEPVGLVGTNTRYFPASKYELAVVERGDVVIRCGRRWLSVPKGLAVIEYEDAEPAVKAVS